MRILLIALFSALAIGCTNPGQPVAQNANAPAAGQTPEKLQTAIAHGPEMEKTDPAAAPRSRWSAAGDPIDTKELDAAIMAAEKTVKEKPSDAEAKRALAAAFFKRATALTEARQYASALGDYRRAVKNDPTHTEAKEWIERIVSIYSSINKESPKEGEEPAPLPFSKGT
jgi:tetratricopeptide (TPR) repeat protein